MKNKLQEAVKKLFADGKVEKFIGYEKGSLPLKTRMTVIDSADDADRLVWNSLCLNSLAVYLPIYYKRNLRPKPDEEQSFPKIGIAVKGCDLRAVQLLARENQIVRDHVTAVGVPCQGMVDPTLIAAKVEGEITEVEESGDSLTVKTASGSETLAREEVLALACKECRAPGTEGADVILEGEARAAGSGYSKVTAFEKYSAAERWAYFESELSKCIRCNACRQACPTCYCKECFADQTRPRWVGIGNDLSDVKAFHIGRIMHQAGRCVECDSCVRACPMDIDLRTFTNIMARDIEAMFDYAPGMSLEEVSPLLTFAEDDDQSFISEPKNGNE
jgi:formate dehydrogenase subunit beta